MIVVTILIVLLLGMNLVPPMVVIRRLGVLLAILLVGVV
jgi:hypothetical protein